MAKIGREVSQRKSDKLLLRGGEINVELQAIAAAQAWSPGASVEEPGNYKCKVVFPYHRGNPGCQERRETPNPDRK